MVSNSQRLFKQLVFSRVFNKNNPANSNMANMAQKKIERMQSKTEKILRKQINY